MERLEIKEKLIGKLAELFEDRNVDSNLLENVDLFDDMGMDSMAFITIVVEIEAIFGIIIPDDALLMENFRKVDNIVELVANELKIKDDGEKL